MRAKPFPCAILMILLPAAAQAGSLNVPPSGVLDTPLTVSSLYDGRSTISGTSDVVASDKSAPASRPALRRTTIAPRFDTRPHKPGAGTSAKPVAGRHPDRAPAPVVAEPLPAPQPVAATDYPAPAASAPVYAAPQAPAGRGLFGAFTAAPAIAAAPRQPEPAPSQGSSVSDFFLPKRSGQGGRGLFTALSSGDAAR